MWEPAALTRFASKRFLEKSGDNRIIVFILWEYRA
jgi:hypothetical protein